MTSSARSRRGRQWVIPMVLVLLLVAITGGTVVALNRYGTPVHSGTCEATGLGTSHRYNTERSANAALISAVAVDRGMPPRAASIALATAFQESRLENIDYGDRDSVGLFQQRPSQGWGTAEQIMDPIYSTNAFYDELEKIPNYTEQDINDVAQRVQRSAYPEAYRDHETEGRLFASALTGQSGPNLICSLGAPKSPASPQQVQSEIARQFPRLSEAGSVSTTLGRANGQRPPAAGATTVVINVAGNTTTGWALANWSVANAADLGIVQVGYQGRAWERTAHSRGEKEWLQHEQEDPDAVVIHLAGS